MFNLKKNIFKRWTFLSAFFILLILVVSITVNVIIDPFFQYHKPIKKLNYEYDSIMYQGAGMIKNFDYETLIIGSSLIQNMRPTYAEELFQSKTVKVPLCGIGFPFILDACNLALEKNKSLKRIIMNTDPTLFFNDSEDASFPSYMYDNNIFNDVNYLLNKSVLFSENLNVLNRTIEKNAQENMDEAFSSEKTFYFSEYSAVQSVSNDPINFDEKELYEKFKSGVSSLADVVEKNPDIEFNFFIPPKSVLELKTMSLNSYLDFYCNIIKETFDTFSSYDNCRMFMFQDDEQTVGNLYNYCDTQHFSSNVSDKILKNIFRGENLLTNDNCGERLEKIKKMAVNFDCSVFDIEKTSLKSCDDLTSYTELLKDDRYIYAMRKVSETAEKNDSAVYCGGREYQDKEVLFDFSDGSRIKIDGVTYSYGLDGINYVVYDKKLNRVIDSVRFDSSSGKAFERLQNRRKDGK